MSMTSTDPIADMLSRIRNAAAVNKTEVTLPHSSIKEAVAKLLQSNHYLEDVKVAKSETTDFKELTVTIATQNGASLFTELERVSSPGRRVYVKSDEIPTVKQGRGLVIVSTSKGLMTGVQARKNHLGGELICKVY